MMKVVELTWPEQLFAAQAGVMRRISAINRFRSEPYGSIRLEAWGNDIESAGAEYAVAKLLRLHWVPVLQNPQEAFGDVSGVEVRSTRKDAGRLIVHPQDRDEAAFVLVRGKFPLYQVCGWIRGKDAKTKEHWFVGDGRPAYFVPDRRLLPISELKIEEAMDGR